MDKLNYVGTFNLNEQNEAPVVLQKTDGTNGTGIAYNAITAYYARVGDSSLQSFSPTSQQWKEKGLGLYSMVLPNTIINQEGQFLYHVAPIASGYDAFRGAARIEERRPDQYDVRASVAYSDDAESLTVLVSLHKNGLVVTAPTSCRVRLKKNGGATSQVDATSVAPTADGVFVIQQTNLVLDADSAYEIMADVVYNGTTYTTVDGGVTFN